MNGRAYFRQVVCGLQRHGIRGQSLQPIPGYFLLLALDLVERATDVAEAEWETAGVTIKVVVLSLDLSVNWSKPKVKQGPKLVLSASSNALSACACDRLGSWAWTQDYHTNEVATGEGGP